MAESLGAGWALEWPLPRMNAFMHTEMSLLTKCLGTYHTGIRTYTSMGSLMATQMSFLSKHLVAVSTTVMLLAFTIS